MADKKKSKHPESFTNIKDRKRRAASLKCLSDFGENVTAGSMHD